MTNAQAELSRWIAEMLGKCWHEWKPGKMQHRCTRENILSWQCKKCGCAAAGKITTFSCGAPTKLNIPPPGTPYAADLNAAMEALGIWLAAEDGRAWYLMGHSKGVHVDLFVSDPGTRRAVDLDSKEILATAICEAIKQFKQAQEA